MLQQHRANGKLLLSGEYFVLHGAKALVLPVRLGQSMEIVEISSKNPGIIDWKAFQIDQEWFRTRIKIPDFEVEQSSDPIVSGRLIQFLKAINAMNPDLLNGKKSFQIRTELEFDREWGLGSSSTLIFILAKWAGIGPMELFDMTSNGSGYDIHAANEKSSFIYSKINGGYKVYTSHISSAITPHLYFVYSGIKQNTSRSVDIYSETHSPQKKLIERISEISRNMTETNDISVFEDMIHEHEQILGTHLGKTPVKKEHFADYSGEVKSLGAWGGDFYMFIHSGKKDELVGYLNSKGMNTIFPYNELAFV